MTGMKLYGQGGGNRVYVLAAIIIAALVFYWRLQAFGDMEPRSDNAFFAWWVKGLAAADHFSPQQGAGESLFDALARDETGFLTRLLRPIYNSPTELFKIIPILALYGAAKLFGYSYSMQVAVSLLASVAIPFVLTLFPFWRKRRPDGPGDYWVGFTALVLGFLSFYLHRFSGLGFHNYGILSLVVAVAVSVRILSKLAKNLPARMTWQTVAGLFLANGLALYSYKTNLFLLPPATVLTLLLLPGADWKRKIRYFFTYSILIVILVLPFVPLVVISAGKPDFAQDMTSPILLMFSGPSGGFTEWLGIIAGRAMNWFVTARDMYSLPGLAVGLFGLAVLARDGMSLPLGIVAVHFMAWCFIPLFAASSLRTYPYILPFLALGAAYFFVASFKGSGLAIKWANRTLINKRLVTAAAGGLIAIHIATQVPGLYSSARVAQVLPNFWNRYFAGQGELRPMITEIERVVPPNATLMTWGYGLQFLYRSLKTDDQDIRLPAINALMLRYKAGLLKEHIRKRRLSLSATEPIYVLVDHVMDHVDRRTLGDAVATMIGPEGFDIAENAALVKVLAWRLRTSWPKGVTLYKIVPQGLL